MVDLDAMVGNILQVPSIAPLNDGSWEILVQNAYLPTLQNRLHEIHIHFTLDSEYNPLTPLHKDVKYWGLENAQELYALWFVERAIRIIQEAWAIAQMYYRHLLKHHNHEIQTLLSGMGTIGGSVLDFGKTERRGEDLEKQLMLIRHRLSNFESAQFPRRLFGVSHTYAYQR